MCTLVSYDQALTENSVLTVEYFLVLFVMILGVYWIFAVRNTLFYDTISLLLIFTTIILIRKDSMSFCFSLYAAVIALVYKNQAALSSFEATVDQCISKAGGSLVDRYRKVNPNKKKTNIATVARLEQQLNDLKEFSKLISYFVTL